MIKTKIICTIGPASSGETILRKMMRTGMDVARLNFSHSNHFEHQQRIESIRALNKKYGRKIKILQDLEGYRIRIGKFNPKFALATSMLRNSCEKKMQGKFCQRPPTEGLKEQSAVELKKRDRLILTNELILGDAKIIPFDYAGSLKDIKPGTRIYIDDGNIELLVKQSARKWLQAEVVISGILKEHKGINMPEITLKFKGLTPKDKQDIEFGVKNKVDFIAQSFVRDKFDILPVRKLISGRLDNCKIIAKIENRQGIKNIDGIIEVSDGIMIARGDMGVSIPIYEIPVVQKQIIKKCNQAKKFVITATQMLESMVENLRPTRAEVTDVANAVIDGSDYLMLSAETAAGKHPGEAVEMMNQIIKFTENNRGHF